MSWLKRSWFNSSWLKSLGLKLGIEKYGLEMSFNPVKSTPYVMGEKENSYSKLRTSKVMYMNEKLVPMAMTLSKKITLATRYHMKKEKYASENFQVMNYGIGGRISGHLDSTGNKRVLLLLLSITYRISMNSFRGNYSFLNLAICTVTFGNCT